MVYVYLYIYIYTHNTIEATRYQICKSECSFDSVGGSNMGLVGGRVRSLGGTTEGLQSFKVGRPPLPQAEGTSSSLRFGSLCMQAFGLLGPRGAPRDEGGSCQNLCRPGTHGPHTPLRELYYSMI